MTEIGLNEKDWQRLVRTIERGQCVLMLGADIASYMDNTKPPLTTLFARTLAEQLDGKATVCDSDDLPQVAQTYIANRIGDRNDLEIEVESFYEAYRQDTTELHQCLAQLPFSYCISITPDEFMRNAFLNQGKAPTEAFYHFRQTQPLTVTPSQQSPLIYQLYGSLSDSRSLVLTETDLLDFLVNIIAGSPELPPQLSTLLCDNNTSFLFIGFGFHRWYLRILLHVFRKQLNNNPLKSVALENTHFFSDPVHEQTVLFYDHTHAIEIKHCSWNELAENLLRRYQDKTNAKPKITEIPLPKDAPTVFLCHCSQDSETVGQLGEKLRALGINTWRDRDNLRGGDDWDKRIKHLIDHDQINYFLVLQTPNMLAKSESYFFREIKFALYRQDRQKEDCLFIIPVYLAGLGDEKLAELKRLDYLDLRNDKDLAKLVANIIEDQQKRKARELSYAGQ